MFEWLMGMGGDSARLEPILRIFKKMLMEGRHMFDLASNALLAGSDTEIIRKDLFKTDVSINKSERRIRRKLIVHASVYGTAEFPTCLVLMSIAKDAERIGDYCKNIYDLAYSRPADGSMILAEPLGETKEKLSALLAQTIQVYDAQDQVAARVTLRLADALENECDEHIHQLVMGKVKGEGKVICALAFRYFKRISSHAKNIMSSVVMPLDKLNYVSEDDEKN